MANQAGAGDLGLFRILSRYNQWANRRLYSDCANLGNEFSKPRAAFFGSICGTLNHLLLMDRNWFGRVVGDDPRLSPLSRILHRDFDTLWSARRTEDQRIIDIVDAFDPAALSSEVEYRNTAGDLFSTPLNLVLLHCFNHQTHHRGQVHDMLCETATPPPPLDFVHYVRNTFGDAVCT